MESTPQLWRKTTETLLPSRPSAPPAGQYDIYPAFPIGSGQIMLGYDTLAARLAGERRVVIDGYGGVFWAELRAQLDLALVRLGVRGRWLEVAGALRPPAEIDGLVAPFLGGDDLLFGTRFTGGLRDFFDGERLQALRPDGSADLDILYGTGAALAGWQGCLVYVDLPKNEIQFRARAGRAGNLGLDPEGLRQVDPKALYKRLYFLDWPALNGHKAGLLSRIDVVVDEQRPHEPAWISGRDLRAALTAMGHNYFRARPWFEPGPWGGQWMKAHIQGLSAGAQNYAWSFELIAPENGLLLASDGRVLEVSFDWLMYHAAEAVLGDSASRFGYEFPIRFDYLDTWEGGNLSVQCHPRPEYIREHFGESFTQDESYYIVDCKPEAQVYLGFQAGVAPAAFREAVELSFRQSAVVEIQRFVRSLPAHKHELFLIPNGTIHGAGRDNLVLEISATPYIFTFKIYDWLRLDLDGRPRPLNVGRALANLCFERQWPRVEAELVSHPYVLRQGPCWLLIHLPTHPAHFYDVHRFEFLESVEEDTGGSPHVLNLVEGSSVVLETAIGLRHTFSFAETFVVPAAAGSYRLINGGEGTARVVKAFLKKPSRPNIQARC